MVGWAWWGYYSWSVSGHRKRLFGDFCPAMALLISRGRLHFVWLQMGLLTVIDIFFLVVCFIFFNVYLFLIDWWLVYSNGLIFVTHQHEYIPSLSNLPPTPSHLKFIPTLLGYSRVPVWVPESYGKFPLAIYLRRNFWFSKVLTMCHFLSVLEVLTHIIQSLQPPWLVGTPIIPLYLL